MVRGILSLVLLFSFGLSLFFCHTEDGEVRNEIANDPASVSKAAFLSAAVYFCTASSFSHIAIIAPPSFRAFLPPELLPAIDALKDGNPLQYSEIMTQLRLLASDPSSIASFKEYLESEEITLPSLGELEKMIQTPLFKKLRYNFELSRLQNTIAVSALPIGALATCLLAFMLPLDSTTYMQLSCILLASGQAIAAIAVHWMVLALGRLFIGMGTGLASSCTMPMLSTEVKRLNANISRNVITFYPLIIPSAIFVSGLLIKFRASGPFVWRYLYLPSFACSVQGLLLLTFFRPIDGLGAAAATRPRGRGIHYNSTKGTVTQTLLTPAGRGEEERNEENTQVSAHVTSPGPKKIRSVLVLIAGHVLQQLSFINGYFFYAGSVFVDADRVLMLLGLANVLGTILNVLVTKFVPAKRFDLKHFGASSGLGCAIASFLFAAAMKEGATRLSSHASRVAIVSAFIFCFAFGYGPVPWIITKNIFPDETRVRFSSLGALVNWSATITVALSTEWILATAGRYAFVFFGACCLAYSMMMQLLVPPLDGRAGYLA